MIKVNFKQRIKLYLKPCVIKNVSFARMIWFNLYNTVINICWLLRRNYILLRNE